MPGFSSDIYSKLVDSDASDLEKMTNRYAVPYIIWQNDAAKNQDDFSAEISELNLPENGRISSFYLYHILLSLLDLEHLDPFTQYSLAMLEKYPIIMENYYFDFAGEGYFEGFPEDIQKLMGWQYYRIIDEK